MYYSSSTHFSISLLIMIANRIINVKMDHSLFLLFSDTDSVLSYIKVFSPRSVQTISPTAAAAVPATYMQDRRLLTLPLHRSLPNESSQPSRPGTHPTPDIESDSYHGSDTPQTLRPPPSRSLCPASTLSTADCVHRQTTPVFPTMPAENCN